MLTKDSLVEWAAGWIPDASQRARFVGALTSEIDGRDKALEDAVARLNEAIAILRVSHG